MRAFCISEQEIPATPTPAPRHPLAAGLEEVAQEGNALGGQQAFFDLHLVVEERGIGGLEFAADAAETEVAGAENQAGDARGHQGAGAHDAGFQRAEEGRAFQAVIAGDGGGFAEGQDFGVRGGVVTGDRRVGAASADFAGGSHQHGADGDLAGERGLAGQPEGFTHEIFVGRHWFQFIIRKPMAELEIHHEGNESDPTGKIVGVLAAVLAVLLAVVTIEAHRTHTAAIMHKSTANDQWSYYQANSIKLHTVEIGESLLAAVDAKGDAAEKARGRFGEQRQKYEAQRDEQQEKARHSDEAAEADEHRALRYDVGEGLLEIGLVLSSLYFISRKRMFPVMGVLAGVVGTAIAISGVMI